MKDKSCLLSRSGDLSSSALSRRTSSKGCLSIFLTLSWLCLPPLPSPTPFLRDYQDVQTAVVLHLWCCHCNVKQHLQLNFSMQANEFNLQTETNKDSSF